MGYDGINFKNNGFLPLVANPLLIKQRFLKLKRLITITLLLLLLHHYCYCYIITASFIYYITKDILSELPATNFILIDTASIFTRL